MSKVITLYIAGTLLMLNLMNSGFSQEVPKPSARLMFYNVENLFDTYDDSVKNDNDFLPDGLMKWNNARYKRKINSVYKTIAAAGNWDPPEIVALCEVENRKTLEDLVYGTYLSKFCYRIIHEDSPDPRGIDVCLIYKDECVDIVNYRYWIPAGIAREEFISRSVLYVKLTLLGDTLHLIVNHWPSRRGGVLAGEAMRSKISAMIKQKADSIVLSAPSGAKVIITGDFNCTPDDHEIQSIVTATDSSAILKNLSEDLAEAGMGSYRYMGTWEMIDQMIVSGALLYGSAGLYTSQSMMNVFKPDFLLKKDPKYPGFSPLATYRGYRYQGGFSDHLPILLDLGFR
jgi:hypothetical protein